MPGLCYPKARRNTEDNEQCHGYRLDIDIIAASGRLDNVGYKSLEEFPLRVLKVEGMKETVFPFVKAPMATKYNSLCPFSLLRMKCKVSNGQRCS